MTVAEMNAHLSDFGMSIIQDENGWHERMSLNNYDTPEGAYEYALEYATAIFGICDCGDHLAMFDEGGKCSTCRMMAENAT